MNSKINSDLLGPRSETWWTGPKPVADEVIRSLPQLRLDKCSREDVLKYFENAWLITEVLFSALQGEEAFMRPPYHSLRHPLIFYYAHPAVLYVNKLRISGLYSEPVDPYFEHLFEVGVDEMSWDDMSKNEMEWPSIAEVTAYRRKVYRIVKNIIETHPAFSVSELPITPAKPAWALAMGFEHERIHLETSSVLMRELPLNLLRKPDHWPAMYLSLSPSETPRNDMIAVPIGAVTIGKPFAEATFGWDNEYGLRKNAVRSFQASKFLVSNGEFLTFVKAGGYSEEKYWTSNGWRWRLHRNSKWPAFWVQNGPSGSAEFKLRRIFDEIAFDNSLPVAVNFHEVQAYCAWRSELEPTHNAYRTISEDEHHRLRQETRKGPWNFELRSGAELPVNATLEGKFADVFGNLWQWCEDDFNALPSFRVHPFYEDFSTPCFDGKHQMMLGGSFMSTGDEASPWARFQFRPHFFQHAGFRLARSMDENPKSDAVKLDGNSATGSNYESDDLLNQYMNLHFANASDVLPYNFGPKEALSFPKRCAEVVAEYAQKLNIPTDTALDLGCAVGGASFELAKTYKQVIGVDLSESFIAAAQLMKDRNAFEYVRKEEGLIRTRLTAKLPADVPRERTSFRQADASSLPANFVDFDAVLVANLLCRLPSPRACLSRMSGPRGIVKRGGLLVLFSPYSWLGDHTPQESWLGGFEKNGKPVYAKDTLKTLLGQDFELLHQEDFPLLIREHVRKYQYIVSHLMVWRRR
ncbi:MAG: 5-histidylcysteine sulfoxide synthase [Bdellovibrionaceae bacterium]|nr:5-histidylcysteine sulfoxide synthase [Pseudobdellovibrionaceae bacterium]